MTEKYDVGSYTPIVNIDIGTMIDKNEDFIRSVRGGEKAVLEGIDNAFDILLERGLAKCKELMGLYGLGGSLLEDNLRGERLPNGLTITTSSTNQWGYDYAMYVEFGTGIVGSRGKPHPKLSEQGWKYDVNQHGEAGWVYPSSERDPNRNKWQDKNGNWFAWTKGQEARPFMYETWLYISRSWHSTMQAQIKKSLREWGAKIQ